MNVKLATARGTGTNGFIQRNLGYIAKRREAYDYAKAGSGQRCKQRAANPQLLEHERKRQVELACLQLQDALEAQGTQAADQIAQAVSERRLALLQQTREADISCRSATDTHITAKQQEAKMKKLQALFDISAQAVEGDAFKEIKRSQL